MVPFNSFAEYVVACRAEPGDEEEGCRVVRTERRFRPLTRVREYIWTTFPHGDRGTKSKPIPGPGIGLMASSLASLNRAVVEPIHPAKPVFSGDPDNLTMV